MKIKTSMFMLVFAAVSVDLHAANSSAPAPLPDFMNQQQLVQWNSETNSARQSPAGAERSDISRFYTGRPFVEDVGGFVYKYRTFSPQMNGWTSADPIGFPDGLNAYKYYPNPISRFDYAGCFDSIFFDPAQDGLILGQEAAQGGYALVNFAIATLPLTRGTGIRAVGTGVTMISGGVGAIELSVTSINEAYANTSNIVTKEYGDGVKGTVFNDANLIAFDVGVAQGYVSELQSALNAVTFHRLSNRINSLINIINSTIIDPLKDAQTTLANERTLINVYGVDGTTVTGYE